MKNLLIFNIVLFFCSFEANTQILTDNQIKKHIIDKISTVQSLQCDFVQTKKQKLLANPVISKGKMYYQNANKLRWEYITPYSSVFIFNANKALSKNDNDTKVIDIQKNKVFKGISEIMLNTISGNFLANDNDFKISFKQSSEMFFATLLPQNKEMKKMFQNIILHFERKTAVVSKVEIIETNGDKTIIDFKNIKRNEEIPNKIFDINALK